MLVAMVLPVLATRTRVPPRSSTYTPSMLSATSATPSSALWYSKVGAAGAVAALNACTGYDDTSVSFHTTSSVRPLAPSAMRLMPEISAVGAKLMALGLTYAHLKRLGKHVGSVGVGLACQTTSWIAQHTPPSTSMSLPSQMP